MRKTKIGQICKITSGGTPSRKKAEYYKNGNIKWVKTGDLKTKYVHDATEYITDDAVANSSAKLFPPNTVLIAMYGATIGVCSILMDEAATNQACAALLPSEHFIPEYMYYYISYKKKDIVAKGVGGAQPNISAKILKDYEIPLPPLETQKKIVEVLDKAQGLIDARKEQIRLMDELIQSVFYEMFGDPVTNPKGWENQRLDSICTKIGSGATPRGGKSSYKAEGISLIRSMNVHNGVFKYDELAFIDNAQAKKLSNVVVEKSDVLLNITGASVARSCIVPEKILPARVNQHVSIVRVNKEKANSRYINNLFISSSFQKVLMKIATSGGATREAITKEQLNELYIPIPHIRLQNDFDILVQKIEANKNLLFEALIDLEKNYYSLLQKAFRGELFGGE